MTFLRWAAVLPAAILGGVFGRFLLVIPTRLAMSMASIEPGSIIWTFGDRYVSGLALGLAFVCCGVWVAPTRKRETAAVLLGLTLVLLGGALFPFIGERLLWGVFELVFIAGGALAATASVWQGEMLSGSP